MTAPDPFAVVLGSHRGPQPLAELAGVRLTDSPAARAYVAAARLPLSAPWDTRAHYVVTVAEDSLCPSRSELELLRGYVECVTVSFYQPGLAAQMLDAPYAGDDGHVTRTFSKRGSGDWTYRVCTWTHGPRPQLNDPPLTLLEALDLIEQRSDTSSSDRWQAWRDAHPDLCR